MRYDMKEIGRRIRQIRGELSLEEFEKKLGVSKNTLSNYERGKGNPKAAILFKLAEHGGVSIEWLFTGREPRASMVCEEPHEHYGDSKKTDDEIFQEYADRIVEQLEREGVERVVAEKMLDAVFREMRLKGKGTEGYINLGEFLKDSRRRLEKDAARYSEQAAEGEAKES